jgi:hypothetical protein
LQYEKPQNVAVKRKITTWFQLERALGRAVCCLCAWLALCGQSTPHQKLRIENENPCVRNKEVCIEHNGVLGLGLRGWFLIQRFLIQLNFSFPEWSSVSEAPVGVSDSRLDP